MSLKKSKRYIKKVKKNSVSMEKLSPLRKEKLSPRKKVTVDKKSPSIKKVSDEKVSPRKVTTSKTPKSGPKQFTFLQPTIASNIKVANFDTSNMSADIIKMIKRKYSVEKLRQMTE